LRVSRLPYLRYDDLDPAAKEVWDSIVGSRADAMLNEQGGLTGPFNAFVRAPGVGRHLTALGLALRYETSIPRRLTEVAILTVGARWKAEFEWWAHAQMASRHGVADAVIEAIRLGEEPPFEAEDERTVYRAARQLAEDGQLSRGAYGDAEELLGHAGVVELITLCGYYTLISFLLNGLAVPLPSDATPAWGTTPACDATSSG
jgi:4-carboxymuconolactone decarboxylase